MAAGAPSKTTVVAAGASLDVTVPLPTGRSRVLWDFSTEGYDIGFGAQWLGADAVEPATVVATAACDSHVLPITGAYESDCAGTLTLTWDNKKSWLTSKKVTYSVHVETGLAGRARGAGDGPVVGALVAETAYGAGTVMERREDGGYVVDLGYGVAYLRPDTATVARTYDPTAPFEPQSRFQLERELALRRMLARRGMTPAEAAFADHACQLRYLRARQWDVEQAYAMLCDTLHWRFVDRDFRPDEMTDEGMRAAGLAYFICFVAGHDREGRPVLVMRMDKPNSLTTLQKLRVTVYALEKAIAMLPRDGSQQRVVCVFDFKGFAARHVNFGYARAWPRIFQGHYPERLHKCIMINVPSVFGMLWSVVQTVLDPKTKRKVAFLGNDTDEGTLNAMREQFGHDVLARVLAELPDYDPMLTQAPFTKDRVNDRVVAARSVGGRGHSSDGGGDGGGTGGRALGAGAGGDAEEDGAAEVPDEALREARGEAKAPLASASGAAAAGGGGAAAAGADAAAGARAGAGAGAGAAEVTAAGAVNAPAPAPAAATAVAATAVAAAAAPAADTAATAAVAVAVAAAATASSVTGIGGGAVSPGPDLPRTPTDAVAAPAPALPVAANSGGGADSASATPVTAAPSATEPAESRGVQPAESESPTLNSTERSAEASSGDRDGKAADTKVTSAAAADEPASAATPLAPGAAAPTPADAASAGQQRKGQSGGGKRNRKRKGKRGKGGGGSGGKA